MRRSMFKSKIHRATVTEASVDYEGSVTIDRDLMDAADMLPWEELQVWDLESGVRLVSYILPGPRGSGTVCMNGAAAHLIKPGHKVILATFVQLDEEEAHRHRPRVILVDDHNQIRKTSDQEQPFQVALTS